MICRARSITEPLGLFTEDRLELRAFRLRVKGSQSFQERFQGHCKDLWFFNWAFYVCDFLRPCNGAEADSFSDSWRWGKWYMKEGYAKWTITRVTLCVVCWIKQPCEVTLHWWEKKKRWCFVNLSFLKSDYRIHIYNFKFEHFKLKVFLLMTLSNSKIW